MSIIAVENVPAVVGLKALVKELKKPIFGHFEALNFAKSQNSNHLKVCYIRLSERVDPVHAVQNINNRNYKSRGKYYAFIPDKVPDIPLGSSSKSKGKRQTPGMRKQTRIADDNANGGIINYTTDEIIAELQAKYPGLYSFSEKYNHKLLQEITKTVFKRVEDLLKSSPALEESCFQATRAYRRAHPHSGDLALVQAALNALHDAAGTPRQALQEADITSSVSMHHDLDLPMDKVKSLCDRYTPKIVAKMSEHVNGLNSMICQIDTEEEIASKQVRHELKKLQPFLSLIVSQVINKQMIPQTGKFHRMRIYGEPFLPNKETMMPFLARFRPRRPMRSMRMYNMLKLCVSPAHYQQLVAMNGTMLNGAKLIIGSSDVIMVKASRFSMCDDGGEGDSDDEPMDEEREEQNWDDVEM